MFGIQPGCLSCIFGIYSIKFARVDHLFTVHFPRTKNQLRMGMLWYIWKEGLGLRWHPGDQPFLQEVPPMIVLGQAGQWPTATCEAYLTDLKAMVNGLTGY
jgi:hypothetical protein